MASSSTTSSVHKSFKYDVYLSFRGEDTRRNFIDHLYSALQQQGIYTHKDDEKIERGGSIKDVLLKSIQNSKFFIVVFSKNYASSAWCLDELVNIMECHSTTHQTVFPVFYDVDPTEVRHQTGAFGEAFAKHNDKEEAGKWREALLQAGNVYGWDLKNTADGHEAEFIKKIVEDISFKLHSTSLRADANLVGMEARVKKVLSSLKTSNDDVRMIGIWGIGGGGKTTLAKTVFDRLSTQFEGKSFVENVREVSRASLYGLQLLQKKTLSDVLDYQGITISSVFDGEIIIKEWLHYRKVLIVLDDVDHIDQLEALAGEPNWFSPGSIIIVTTRDKHVLVEHRVKLIHSVELLSHDEAIYLFNRHAFVGDIPIQGYKELALEAVRYAAGLPLTIKVLGSFLCGKDKLEWEAVLEKLKTIPLKETPKKLELSYINLKVDYKEVFLDVACLLNGLLIDNVIRILESCGFYGRAALRVLEQKSLITINDDQYVVVHPLIEAMGKDIVRHLCPNRPNKHSRLWISNEIEYVLAKDLGSEATKAIVVDSPVEPGSQIVTKGFGSMKQLRLLRVVSEIDDNYDEKIGQISPDFPDALRYLSWEGYPLVSLPKQFEPNNLVTFEMPYSRVTQLWEGGEQKVLSRLRFLDLRHSQLTTLDLGMTPNLETLDLEDCNHLVQLHTPVGGQKTLASLNLSGCPRIKSFMFIQRLESLEVLSLSRLYLKEFPDIIPGHCNSGLLELGFRHNNIEQLPSSIGNLKKLVHLDLHSCTELKSLPGSICGLRHLRNLKLSDCDQLEVLPEDIDGLECLEKLNLSFARIKHLPYSICKLKCLKTLKLSFCRNLEKLPGDIGQLECLQKLILEKCIQVRDIPDSICQLKSLKYLSLLDCSRLENLPTELGCLVSLEVLNVQGTRIRQLPLRVSSLICLEIHAPKNIQFMSTWEP